MAQASRSISETEGRVIGVDELGDREIAQTYAQNALKFQGC